jgi:hypothetical protein
VLRGDQTISGRTLAFQGKCIDKSKMVAFLFFADLFFADLSACPGLV